MDISRGTFSESDKYFGHADYYHHKQQGMTAQELLNWVGQNFDKFSPGTNNQPGGGGLYDQMVADAEMERFTQQTMNANKNLVDTFASQMANLNSKMLEQQKSYESTLSQMTNTLRSQQTPNTRASSMGVSAPQSNNPAIQTIRRQGMAGQFGREGLRIKNMNV